MVALYLLAALLLLLLNAFFVLAEFAAVKMRSTRVEELARAGDARALVMEHVQSRIDEYLSVCQVGITLASIGLGFVGEAAFARLIEPAFRWTGAASSAVAHGVAITVAYVGISALHVILGELVPKSMAIRGSEATTLRIARPLRFFHALFYVPLVVLNGSANLVLRLLGYPPRAPEPRHTEGELKIILAGSQSSGVLSFRRLLLLENVFDLADLRVRDVMKPRDAVRTLDARMSWEAAFAEIARSRYSRYPVVDRDGDVAGLLHVKDVLYEVSAGRPLPELRALVRPARTVDETARLEHVLTELQRRRAHAAIVRGPRGAWTGFITLEDLLEQIVGTIEDEFEVEPPVFLADTLTSARVVLDLSAPTFADAIREAIARADLDGLPAPPDRIAELVLQRERAMSTYVGAGAAIPHARLENLARSVLVVGRSVAGVPLPNLDERATLLFILLTPAGAPREQVRLVARVARLLESAYAVQRLREARSAAEVVDIIREGDPAK